MEPKRKKLAIVLMLALAVCSGCIHKNPNFTAAQNVQVNLYSTVQLIATTNRDVLKAIVALNAAGSVPDAITRAVVDNAERVNNAVKAAQVVLDSGQGPEQKTAAVLAALAMIKDLPPPVRDFVNSNPNVAAVMSVVRSIVTIQQSIAQVAATPPALLRVGKEGAK